MITALGIICILCNIVQGYSISRLYWNTPASVKSINTLLAGMGGCAINILFISLFILMRPERENNIEKNAYLKGIEQQWEYKIDTTWTPKRK